MAQKVGMSGNWIVCHTGTDTRRIVEHHLASHKMRIVGASESQLEVEGGSQVLTRLLGMLLIPRTRYPTRAKITIAEADSGTSVEATIENRKLPLFIIDPIAASRYNNCFEIWLDELGTALAAKPPHMG